MRACFAFGPDHRFELDVAGRALRCEGRAAALGARGFDVLTALVEREGALVTKDELLQRAWPGLVVEEGNIHVQVSQLRKLLGAEAIATVPGVGYRFALAVRRSGGAAQVRAHGPAHNLPAERTAFVGRESALAEAMARLRGTRLLTLIGIGGTGKTRLAAKLAERCLDAHADGVWWVDLAPLESAEQLVQAIAQALSPAICQKLPASEEPLPALLALLRDRELLLVLDNGEHLVEALAALAGALLQGAARIKLLVTSREALAMDAESVLPVRPLALPEPRSSAQAIGQSEAVQLFVERAAKVAPGFALDEHNAPTVAELCRRVDGIPLALELAAAHLRVVGPAQLLGVLQERFRSLEGQRRALPRQQTLHAVIQWSYDHLQAGEQELLCCLAVCSGGCDLDAARALLGDAAQASLLAGLARLAEQSLLTVQHDGERTRYHLLETVRQFTLDQLHDSGRAAEVRDRHARHYLAMAEAHDEEIMRHGEGAATLARIDGERDNLLRALDWCSRGARGDGDAEAVTMGLRLAFALRHFWPARGLNALGLETTLAALARADAAKGRPADRHQSRVLTVLTHAYWRMGQHDKALVHAWRNLEVADSIDDGVGRALAHANIGNVERSLGHLETAESHLRTSLRIADDTGDTSLYPHALHGLAAIATARGQAAEADQRFRELLDLRRREGHGYRLVTALLNAASAAVDLNDWARVHGLLREAASLHARVGSRLLSQYLLEFTAALSMQRGDNARAVRLYAASMTQRQAMQLPLADEVSTGRLQKALASARERLGEEAFESAWAEGVVLDHAAALVLMQQALDEPVAAGP
jgi:predicted ATPase/DNA-binding winged helix-turn-helix (wHTH) protein